ncbi:MAG TPA: VanZ family protein [Flavisolibacter sp.]|nr:VanZ family protein [Flavisolibacter sp.]
MRRTRQILVVALFISGSIECIQYALRIGVADIDDVLLNFAGACLGLYLLAAFSSADSELSHASRKMSFTPVKQQD